MLVAAIAKTPICAPNRWGNVWHLTVSRPKPAKPESLQST
jgi:hypothetical protein